MLLFSAICSILNKAEKLPYKKYRGVCSRHILRTKEEKIMRKNRTIASAAALLSVMLMLAGCGDNPSSSPGTQTQATQLQTESTEAKTETETEAQPSEISETSGETEASETAASEEQASETPAEVPVSEEEQSSGASPADIVAEITANVEMSSLAEVGADRLGNFIEADPEKTESFSMFICGSGAFADEVAVFAMKDESDVQAVADSMQARIESRSIDFEDYNPDEYDKLRHALIKTKGRYVMLIVSNDNDTAESIFDKYVN